MRLRRFVGVDAAAALQRVKDALGPDALVLETRAAPGGGVEILAASDPSPPGWSPGVRAPVIAAAAAAPVGCRATERAGTRAEALVGPPGDGKTTTAAKLAARAAATGGRPGLVVADDRRIGAAAQLGAIAGLLEVPVRVARDGEELAACLRSLEDCDVVWIDCAGLGTEPSQAADLRHLLAAAGEPVRVTAVLGGTASRASLARAWRALEPLEPQGCVLTKLDLAGDGADLRAWLDETGVTVRWLATGQDPLGDLVSPQPENLETWIGRA